jgi:hypothetical protein
LEPSLDQLASFYATIHARPSSSSAKTDVYCSADLQASQCWELKSQVKTLFGILCGTVGYMLSLPEPYNPRHVSQSVHKEELIQFIVRALESIDYLSKWMTRDEVGHIIQAWEIQLWWFDKLLATLTNLINPMFKSDPKSNGLSLARYTSPLSRIEDIQLAELFVPIFKLSRLFFKKSARMVANSTPSKPLIDVDSYQLHTAKQSVHLIGGDLVCILGALERTRYSDRASTGRKLIKFIKSISDCWNSPLRLIDLYIIPLIPHLENPSSQTCFRTWLSNWHTVIPSFYLPLKSVSMLPKKYAHPSSLRCFPAQ